MNGIVNAEDASAGRAARYTLWQLVRCMLALSTWGFGGPRGRRGLHVPRSGRPAWMNPRCACLTWWSSSRPSRRSSSAAARIPGLWPESHAQGAPAYVN